MPNEVHKKILVAAFDFGFGSSFANLDSLADADAAYGDQLTTLEDCEFLRIFYRLKTGTSPTDGGILKFYWAESDGTILAGDTHLAATTGTITVDASVDELELQLGPPVHTQPVNGSSDVVYEGFFDILEPNAAGILVIVNDTGAALNGTASPHRVRGTGYGREVQ